MAGRNFLFVPGPTNVPDRVLRAMVVAMEDHRSPAFPELTRAYLDGLKPVFKTTTASPRSEMAMLDAGVKLAPGSGVAAAQNYWRSHSPVSAAKEPSGATA